MNQVVEGIEYEVLDFNEIRSAQEWREAYNNIINKIKTLPKCYSQFYHRLLKRYNEGERTPDLWNWMTKE